MSENLKISSLLQGASKSGNGIGKPEFIITCSFMKNLLIVIECKASIKKHISETLQQVNDYAVDGALHYAKFLSAGYDVIAIGISGQSKAEMKIDTYFWLKKDNGFTKLSTKKILPFDEYLSIIENNRAIDKRKKYIFDTIQDKNKYEKEMKTLLTVAFIFCPLSGAFIGRLLKPYGELGNKIVEVIGWISIVAFVALYLSYLFK